MIYELELLNFSVKKVHCQIAFVGWKSLVTSSNVVDGKEKVVENDRILKYHHHAHIC